MMLRSTHQNIIRMKSNSPPPPQAAKQMIHPDKLRRALGILGILFPFALVLGSWFRGCTVLQGSISDYYHTSMGDVFGGFLCAYAMFLFTYRGHDWIDNWAANLAGAFALGIALFPTMYKEGVGCTHTPWFTYHTIHMICAASFFLVLSYFSLFLFTKTKEEEPPSTQKLKRNVIYKVCGVIMLVCIALIALYMLLLQERYTQLQEMNPTFWLESIALFVFGVSWLVKGHTILNDK